MLDLTTIKRHCSKLFQIKKGRKLLDIPVQTLALPTQCKLISDFAAPEAKFGKLAFSANSPRSVNSKC